MISVILSSWDSFSDLLNSSINFRAAFSIPNSIKLKVIVNSCGGAASPYVKNLLEKMGAKVLCIYGLLSNGFPRKPESLSQNIKDLCASVKEHGGTMRIVSFIEDHKVTEKIIKHLNLAYKSTRLLKLSPLQQIRNYQDKCDISNPFVQGHGKSLFFLCLTNPHFLVFSPVCGLLVDRTCFLCVLLMMMSL